MDNNRNINNKRCMESPHSGAVPSKRYVSHHTTPPHRQQNYRQQMHHMNKNHHHQKHQQQNKQQQNHQQQHQHLHQHPHQSPQSHHQRSHQPHHQQQLHHPPHHPQQNYGQNSQQPQNVAPQIANQPYYPAMSTPPTGIHPCYPVNAPPAPTPFQFNVPPPTIWHPYPFGPNAPPPPLPLVPPTQNAQPMPPQQTQLIMPQQAPLMSPQQAPQMLPPATTTSPEEKYNFGVNNAFSYSNGGAVADNNTHITMKVKRKSLSKQHGFSKKWNQEDALKAIALEKEYAVKTKNQILLRFPDPELSHELVSAYSTQIESVHFPYAGPRYCHVHLKEDADVEQVIADISKIPFGTGLITAEVKRTPYADPQSLRADEVYPYALYVGNLPETISSRNVKQHFPGALRIDIGFPQRMKRTRYALVRYRTIEESLAAFRSSVNTLIEGRSVIVRFYRNRGSLPNDEQPTETKEVADGGAVEDIATVAPEKDEVQADTVKTLELQKVEEQPNNDSAAQLPPVDDKEVTCIESASAPQGSALPLIASAFDSPTSLERPDHEEIDNKSNVFSEAEELRQRLQLQPTIAPVQRRNSLQEMFAQLDQITTKPSDTPPTPVTSIKKETVLFDDDGELSEEEDMPVNLLGRNYENPELLLKAEQSESPPPRVSNSGDNLLEWDEFEDELDKDDDDYTDHLSPIATTASKTGASSSSKTNWETIRKQELTQAEQKPQVDVLAQCATTGRTDAAQTTLPFGKHLSDIERLYKQRRQFSEFNDGKRQRDELTDMFAQMNSDSEEDDYYHP